MRRLLRRARQEASKKIQNYFHRPSKNGNIRKPGLVAECLESRVLLTTLTLSQGQTELIFDYADPEGTGTGGGAITTVSNFNEIRISTISGQPVSKDVSVELLNPFGGDIPGNINGVPVGGGPGGVGVISQVGPMDSFQINALATNSIGQTFGISSDGVLYSVNTATAEAQVINVVSDSDHPNASSFVNITYSNVQAAEFDPVSDTLYAVVEGPIAFNALGLPSVTGQVMITIDTNTGEAEPVGRDINGLANYQLSQINATEITSIVYSQEAGDNTSNLGISPVFIAYDDALVDQFVRLSVNGVDGSPFVDVTTDSIVAMTSPTIVIEGLMYSEDFNGANRLFGLNNGESQLAEINLANPDPAAVVVNFFAFPASTFPGADFPATLTGMSYNPVTQVGFATDPVSGSLYNIVTANLIPNPEDASTGLVVQGGISDIYQMYIASSTPDVQIVMTYYTITDGVKSYQPTGGAPAFLYVDEDETAVFTPDNAGGVMLGTIAVIPPDDGGGAADSVVYSPVTFNNPNHLSTQDPGPIGVYPGGFYRPGITVAPEAGTSLPQDIGKIQVGGGVFGDVQISGSVGTFYAGYLGTNTFEVEGDVQNLVVGTQAGGIREADGAWTPIAGAVVNINGELGSFYSNNDWGMPIRVHARSNAPSFPGVLDVFSSDADTQIYVPGVLEFERKIDTEGETVFFPQGAYDSSGAPIISNDSPYLAQYVGSIDGNVSIFGQLEGDDNIADGEVVDAEDYYSFGVLAGQTFEISLYNTFGLTNGATGHPANPTSQIQYALPGGLIDVFDPELNWIGNLGELDHVTGLPVPLEITAEKAGIYTVAVNGVYVSGVNEFTKRSGFTYRLDINGLSSTTLGGGNVVDEIRFATPLIQVTDGNIGAISSGGSYRSADIIVSNGSMAALRAGANALPLTTDFAARAFDQTPPNTGLTPTQGFDLELSDQDGVFVIDIAKINISGDMGRISSPLSSNFDISVGNNLQSLKIGSTVVNTGLAALSGDGDGGTGPGDEEIINNLTATVVVNGSIGEFSVQGSFGPEDLTNTTVGDDEIPSALFVNADGIGEPGIIDSLLVGGNFDSIVSVGNRSGNVRFVDIGGSISHLAGGFISTFGPFGFNAGQSVTVTDDSGVLVNISPGFKGPSSVDDFLFGATPPPGTVIPTSPGGILTLKLLPISDKTFAEFSGVVDRNEIGFAIANIDSTDGLVVTTDGGPVDIGLVTVHGGINQNAVFRGKDKISILHLAVAAPTGATAGSGETGITQVTNTTGGDIVSLQVGVSGSTGGGLVSQIKVDGHLGKTNNTTGQVIESNVIRANLGTNTADPGGTQRSGLVSGTSITNINVAGALSDVDVTGNVTNIVINSDKSQEPGQFDGAIGPIIITGNLTKIELGDGLPDPGTGYHAQSGLFVSGLLSTVEVTGNGHDINGPIFASGGINQVKVDNGAKILGYTSWGGTGERVRGAVFVKPTIAVLTSFDSYFIEQNFVSHSGTLNQVSVKGSDSEIRNSRIVATVINNITVSNGANGIFDSRIAGLGTAGATQGVINQINVGGEGISNTIIAADRLLSKLNVLPGGKITDSEIRGQFNINQIIADEITKTDIDAFNKLTRVTSRDGIFDLVIEAGELGRLTSGESILGSEINVAGPIGQISAKIDINSTIQASGPFSNLKKLSAGRDIGTPTGGTIIVDGVVGSITAGRDFNANLLLNWDPTPLSPQNPLGPRQINDHDGIELKTLKAGNRIRGLGDIGGDIGSIKSGSEFGFAGEEFAVHGSVKSITVGSKKLPSDIESNVTIDESLGSLKVYGSTNGSINVTDDFKSLSLIGTAERNANITEEINVGGDFNKISIKEGSIQANINVEGKSPKTSIKTSEAPVGAGLNSMEYHEESVTQNLEGDLTGVVIVGSGSDVNNSGSLTGTYISQGDMNRFVLGGDIAKGSVLVVDGDINLIEITGNIEGLIHVTGNVGTIKAANIIGTEDPLDPGLITDGLVTVSGSIGQLDVPGAIQDSYVLAGYDPGFVDAQDGLFNPTELRVDGSSQDVLEQALTGDITKANIGVLDNSVIAAGVSSGTNRIFGDLDGSDRAGAGTSIIGDIEIGLTSPGTNNNPFGVFADTAINRITISGNTFNDSTQISNPNGFRSWIITDPPSDSGITLFENGIPFRPLADNAIQFTVTLVGEGTGHVTYDKDADHIDLITLSGTTSQSRLRVVANGGQTINVDRLITGDDEGLKQISIDGLITSELSIGGQVTKLQLDGISAGATVDIGGDVSRADLGILSGSSASPTEIDILGKVNRMSTRDVSSHVSISAENIDTFQTKGSMSGVLSVSDQLLKTVKITGNLPGIISSEGNIDRVNIKGTLGAEGVRPVQGVRALGDIGRFSADTVVRSVIAAGGNLDQVKVRNSVSFSTFASGLDIGSDGVLSNVNAQGNNLDVPLRGDINKISIGGDFIESNVIAGMNAGDDLLFGTNDDQLQTKSAEQQDAPSIVDVSFPDLSTIDITFDAPIQGIASDVNNVTIKGFAIGSNSSGESFAISAAGDVKSVFARNQAFNGVDNINRIEVDAKKINASSIINDNIDDLATAQSAAIEIRADGFDNEFFTNDDIIVFGDNNALTQASVFITFDENTNTASFHKTDGFIEDQLGTNYYHITVKADSVSNRNSIQLDGEYAGQLPSGDGNPGGDFEFTFAVADLGDSVVSAFAPFQSNFPENQIWQYSGQIGDNQQFPSSPQFDTDFIRLNDLSEGQILNLRLKDINSTFNNTQYGINLWKFNDNQNLFIPQTLIESGARTDLSPARSIVIPEISELAFAGNSFYGYEESGKQFYAIDRSTQAITLLENTLPDLSSLLTTESIVDIKALTGRGQDSFWAIADIQPLNNDDPRTSLLQINNLFLDVSNSNPNNRASVVVSSNDIGNAYNIVGLEELDGTLYGLDANSNALITLDITADPNAVGSTFGEVDNEIGNLGNSELNLKGLSIDPSNRQLIALHDLPEENTNSLLDDALYFVDTTTGLATFRSEFSEKTMRQGIAAEPGGSLLIGLPVPGNPLTDTFKVSVNNQTSLDHVFGSTGSQNLNNGVFITSDPATLSMNDASISYANNGFYFAFQIDYIPNNGLVTVDVTDVEWLDSISREFAIDVFDDDPNFVQTTSSFFFDNDTPDSNQISLTINTDSGDGSVIVYFAATADLENLTPVDNVFLDEIIGTNARTDLSPLRDLLLDQVDELTIVDNVDLDVDDHDGVVYDADQQLFALLNSQDLSTSLITVTDPFNANSQTILTSQVLSDIYSETLGNTNVTLSDFRGFELGRNNELWMIAQVTTQSGSLSFSRDSLVKITDITNPAAGINVASHNLELDGVGSDFFTDIRELAYGFVDQQAAFAAGNLDVSDKMYGLDAATNTLVTIDSREFIFGIDGELTINNDFGKATAVGNQVDNLGNIGTNNNIGFDVTGLSIDNSGRLFGIDNNSNYYVEFDTSAVIAEGSTRMQLVERLSNSDYRAFAFDLENNLSLAARSITDTPVGETFNLTLVNEITVGNVTTITTENDMHLFGAATTPFTAANFSITSTANNDSATVTSEGGFYQFDVSYQGNNGELLLTIDDIDWDDTGVSRGSVDSVFVDDADVQVVGTSEDSITILIDTGTGNAQESFKLYFGASAELVDVIALSELTGISGTSGVGGVAELGSRIPADGDYLVEIFSSQFFGAASSSYDLTALLYDDNNSDFGIAQTTSGLVYDQIFPSNAAIDLNTGSTDLVQDVDDANLFSVTPSTIDTLIVRSDVAGSLLEVGQNGRLIIDSTLGISSDVDIYKFELNEGQRITVDLESNTLSGNITPFSAIVGIYNGDLETITTTLTDPDGNLSNAQQADAFIEAQARFDMPNHPGVVIDPDVNGVGTYYIVVSSGTSSSVFSQTDYQLIVETTEAEPIETPASQLVWLSFEGYEADFLVDDLGFNPASRVRPAFDASVFDLAGFRSGIINAVAARIEQSYREVGLTEDEIEFTLVQPAAGTIYSTVSFGGNDGGGGFYGIAEEVDRDNSNRSDSAIVTTDDVANDWRAVMSENESTRFDQVVNALSLIGAHELGHILGLEHGTSVDAPSEINIMASGGTFTIEQEIQGNHVFGDRNFDRQAQFVGFTNSIDILLRNIGSGTILGE